MKKEILAACSGVIFAASLVAQSVLADEQDYVAKATEDGKFCARIEVRGPAGLTVKKMKCRTIQEWKDAGYKVSAKEE
jgi:hypothetical protein